MTTQQIKDLWIYNGIIIQGYAVINGELVKEEE